MHHTLVRWGRWATISTLAAALSACVGYPQGGGQPQGVYNQGVYQSQGAYNSQGGYNQGGYNNQGSYGNATTYPVPNGSYGGGYNNGGYNNGGYNNGNYPQQPGQYAQQGRVLNVETVRVQDGSGIGAGGAIIGGVLGGVLGHQVGGGRGKDLATIAGVAGGALAGHMAQNSMGGGSVRDVYRVSVQLQDGSVRAFDFPNAPDFRAGEWVRVDGNQIYR